MKQLFAILLCAFAPSAMAQTPDPAPAPPSATPAPDKALAKVNREQGYYIFIQCTPVAEYEVLGTVKKTGIVWSGSPEEMYKIIIRRTKKEYPKADGIIFEDVAMEHATCIVFK